jgi:outer membrane murein-binding lipoprotein Lpp
VRPPRRLVAGVALVVAGLILAATASATSESRTPTLRAKVRAIGSEVRELERKVDLMELSAARYADWQACLRGVPVSEYGDPDRQSGYLYDERDGTGRGYRPALAVDRKSRPRKEDYLFLNFSRRSNCRSDAPLSGGTADPASAHSSGLRRRSLRSTLTDLERRVARMKRAARGLLASSEHFDGWESCVSWVPVTEYGDPDGRFGYLFGARGAAVPGYRPALAIDRSDWDDPDYMFLAFVGGDRPGRKCQDEPGEGVD